MVTNSLEWTTNQRSQLLHSSPPTQTIHTTRPPRRGITGTRHNSQPLTEAELTRISASSRIRDPLPTTRGVFAGPEDPAGIFFEAWDARWKGERGVAIFGDSK